jgi:hypothetical protein
MSSDDKFELTDEKIASALEPIRYEISQLIYAYLYLRTTQNKEVVTRNALNETRLNNRVISNMLLESALIHARILIEFFKPTKKRYRDNIIPDDYGFSSTEVDLDDEIVKRLHKDLSHLSYARVNRTNDTKGWDLRNILLSIIPRCLEFTHHVIKNKPRFAEQKELDYWPEMLFKLKEVYCDINKENQSNTDEYCNNTSR